MLQNKIITKRDFEAHFVPETVAYNMYYNRCFSRYIYIDVVGNIFPCPMERRIMHGSMDDCDSIDKIIKKSILSLNKDKIIECKECEYRYVCKDCRPDCIEDSIFSKPWYCTYHPLEGFWEDEKGFIKKLKME